MGTEYAITKSKSRRTIKLTIDSVESSKIAEESLSITLPSLAKTNKLSSSSNANGQNRTSLGGKDGLDTRKILMQVLKELKKHPNVEPFIDPLDVDSIPRYSDIIKKPMDITTLEKNVKGGLYDHDITSFKTDLQLIFQNCMTYNDPSSELYAWANLLSKHAKDILKNLPTETEQSTSIPTIAETPRAPGRPIGSKRGSMKRETKDGHVDEVEDDDDIEYVNDFGIPQALQTSSSSSLAMPVSDVKPDDSYTQKKFKRSELGPNGAKLWKIVKYLFRHPLASYFQHPVDLRNTPNYLEVVKVPMDLSLIRSRLDKYETKPEVFMQDLRLMFDNCMAYHPENTTIHANAKFLREYAEGLFAEYRWTEYADIATSKRSTGAIMHANGKSE